MKLKHNIRKDFLKPLSYVSLLNRKKDDPKKYVFTGKSDSAEANIELYVYNKDKCVVNKNLSTEQIGVFENNEDYYWLNIYGLNDIETIVSVCEKQGIHNIAIQDILDVNQRPKYQEYESYSFLTLKSIIPSEDNMITEQISFVFGPNFLISFQERKADFFDHLRYRLIESKGILRERPADYLLYAMLESVLDNYFKTLNKLDEGMGKFDFTDPTKDPSPDTLVIIENHKKFVHFIKKSILPIKEFTRMVERGECRHVEKRHLKYFMEIKDLCLTLIDSCDMIFTSLESSTNLFFSMQGHRMNQIMKTLTIVATIFIPLTFITGVYGMNFFNMPELKWKYGYLGIWFIIISLFSVMVMYFKRKKWF